MSSEFEFINPYWDRVYASEEALISETGEQKQTDDASLAIIQRVMERVDLVIFLLDRLDLGEFQLQSGRLNRRKLARALVASIAERNRKRRENGLDEVNEVGLRAMEITLKELLSQK
tara:strand:- start:1003 stop:1353 length:351 start_codon:yes stop_codon:yes gene_type:complete